MVSTSSTSQIVPQERSAATGKETSWKVPRSTTPAGEGAISSNAYNPVSGTFHMYSGEGGAAATTSAIQNASMRLKAGEFVNEGASAVIQQPGQQSWSKVDGAADWTHNPRDADSLSNNGSCSGESEDQGGGLRGGTAAASDTGGTKIANVSADKRDKIRAKNEKKHLRQKEKKAQELRDRCVGFLTARKLESLAENLVSMGFPKDRSTIALICNEGNLERSVAWLLDGGESNGKGLDSAASVKLDVSQEIAAMLQMEQDSGFARADIDRAVIAYEGDLDKSFEFLKSKHGLVQLQQQQQHVGGAQQACHVGVVSLPHPHAHGRGAGLSAAAVQQQQHQAWPIAHPAAAAAAPSPAAPAVPAAQQQLSARAPGQGHGQAFASHGHLAPGRHPPSQPPAPLQIGQPSAWGTFRAAGAGGAAGSDCGSASGGGSSSNGSNSALTVVDSRASVAAAAGQGSQTGDYARVVVKQALRQQGSSSSSQQQHQQAQLSSELLAWSGGRGMDVAVGGRRDESEGSNRAAGAWGVAGTNASSAHVVGSTQARCGDVETSRRAAAVGASAGMEVTIPVDLSKHSFPVVPGSQRYAATSPSSHHLEQHQTWLRGDHAGTGTGTGAGTGGSLSAPPAVSDSASATGRAGENTPAAGSDGIVATPSFSTSPSSPVQAGQQQQQRQQQIWGLAPMVSPNPPAPGSRLLDPSSSSTSSSPSSSTVELGGRDCVSVQAGGNGSSSATEKLFSRASAASQSLPALWPPQAAAAAAAASSVAVGSSSGSQPASVRSGSGSGSSRSSPEVPPTALSLSMTSTMPSAMAAAAQAASFKTPSAPSQKQQLQLQLSQSLGGAPHLTASGPREQPGGLSLSGLLPFTVQGSRPDQPCSGPAHIPSSGWLGGARGSMPMNGYGTHHAGSSSHLHGGDDPTATYLKDGQLFADMLHRLQLQTPHGQQPVRQVVLPQQVPVPGLQHSWGAPSQPSHVLGLSQGAGSSSNKNSSVAIWQSHTVLEASQDRANSVSRSEGCTGSGSSSSNRNRSSSQAVPLEEGSGSVTVQWQGGARSAASLLLGATTRAGVAGGVGGAAGGQQTAALGVWGSTHPDTLGVGFRAGMGGGGGASAGLLSTIQAVDWSVQGSKLAAPDSVTMGLGMGMGMGGLWGGGSGNAGGQLQGRASAAAVSGAVGGGDTPGRGLFAPGLAADPFHQQAYVLPPQHHLSSSHTLHGWHATPFTGLESGASVGTMGMLPSTLAPIPNGGSQQQWTSPFTGKDIGSLIPSGMQPNMQP